MTIPAIAKIKGKEVEIIEVFHKEQVLVQEIKSKVIYITSLFDFDNPDESLYSKNDMTVNNVISIYGWIKK